MTELNQLVSHFSSACLHNSFRSVVPTFSIQVVHIELRYALASYSQSLGNNYFAVLFEAEMVSTSSVLNIKCYDKTELIKDISTMNENLHVNNFDGIANLAV